MSQYLFIYELYLYSFYFCMIMFLLFCEYGKSALIFVKINIKHIVVVVLRKLSAIHLLEDKTIEVYYSLLKFTHFSIYVVYFYCRWNVVLQSIVCFYIDRYSIDHYTATYWCGGDMYMLGN